MSESPWPTFNPGDYDMFRSSSTEGELAVLALRKAAIKQAKDVDIDLDLFTERIVDRLRAAGYRTLADVYRVGELAVLRLDGLGRKSMRAIREGLSAHGFDIGLWAFGVDRSSPEQQARIEVSRQVLLSVKELRSTAARLLRLADLLESGTSTAEDDNG